jgi:hypothetical protein
LLLSAVGLEAEQQRVEQGVGLEFQVLAGWQRLVRRG